MPNLTTDFLRSLASKKGKDQFQAVNAARSRVHGQLGRTQKHRDENAARLEEIVTAADARHADLQKQLPGLASKAESAQGEERDAHHRAYLDAVTQANQCAQIHGSAKRELIIARNL
ncbi:hypothetical protein EON83_10955 [bacterium]|nr:MAG: hypothetical protein EON83_10955 [bacterium]